MKKRSLQNWNKSWEHVQQDFLESKWSDKNLQKQSYSPDLAHTLW